MEAVYLGIGVLLGAAAMWALVVKGLQQRASGFEEEAKNKQADLATAQADVAALNAKIEANENAHKDQIEELKQMRVSAQDAFKVLAENALKENREEFLEGAKRSFVDQREKIESFVEPLKKQLDEYEEHINRLQKEHSGTSAANRQQIEQLMKEVKQQQLLATDLKSLIQGPTRRGRMAEMLLEAMLERAGLVKGLHFRTQTAIEIDGETYIPDAQMSMPDFGEVFIEVKAPLGYEEALGIEDSQERANKLKEHARNVKAAIDDIASKPYKRASRGPALVIMYMPIEGSLAAAQMHDPEISSYGWDKGVIVASPTVLFVLLQTVALAWQQERLRESTDEVKKLGTELVDRIRIVAAHFAKVGSRLDSTTEAYNAAVSSMDQRLLRTAKRFQELGATSDSKDIQLREAIVDVRHFEKPEFQAPPTDEEVKALTELEDIAPVVPEPVGTEGLPVLEEESRN